jgi:hypothetical protein
MLHACVPANWPTNLESYEGPLNKVPGIPLLEG